ncbi:DUF3857 domain-containing protein [Telmatobacter bradus]|uniref:DUF3857 domain-containing protein n=1 Tax=Telmatobacter bradus TaxID=474953 RepID=UPI003B42E22E
MSAHSGAAQTAPPVWPLDGAAFSAAPADLLKSAAAVPAEKFTDATVLFERDSYVLDAEGRVRYRHLFVYRIETQAGVDGWSQVSSRWEPWYEHEPSIHARVVQSDGHVSQLDQKTITDGPASADDEDTFTDARIRKAPLPGLMIGAIVEEETEVDDEQPLFTGGGIYRNNFGHSVPAVRSILSVEVPAGSPLQFRTYNLPQAKVSDQTQDGVRRLVFDEPYTAGFVSGDIRLSSHHYLLPTVEFATGASWAQVARVYRELAEPQIDPQTAKSLLPALIADRMENIRRIVARLHKEVRYTGIEFGQSSLKPHSAAEVLQQHYGDCKDKAALLVSMLRAAGIPANLALLNTGPGVDVTPELSGMNQFDHAIVFVPGAGKSGEPLWIDATAEYAEVGTLPSMDLDRHALVIAEGTTGLTATPEARSADNQLVEKREVRMAEYGPAFISETSLTHGPVDEEYRSEFGNAESRGLKTNLESYAKNYYLAKALTHVEQGDGKDLTKPFSLRLEMAEAKRGNTGIEDGALAIPFSSIFNRLPEWFRSDPQTEGEKLTPQQEEDRRHAAAVRLPDYDMNPFVVEWQYTITPPTGFVLRALPQDKATAMGPASLTQHYEQSADGALHATLRFDTVKPRYTASEALALRDAVLATYRQDMIFVLFDQEAAKLVASGKIREGLAADRQLIERHSGEAIHHDQMAYALLKAGMGARARQEAERATQLDPQSPVAFRTLGWVCEFNEIGIQRSNGFDRDCAEANFRKAMVLDPDDLSLAIDLALIAEFDPNGERYAADAHLAEAARIYRMVREKDKATGEPYIDNLLFVLLYDHRYQELLDELGKLPSTVLRDGVGIAATVALKGVPAGIDKADHLPAGASERASALSVAGSHLLHLRLYKQAADILEASAEGQSNAAAVLQQITIFRQLKPWMDEFFPPSDPRFAVQRMIVSMLEGRLDETLAAEVISRHAYGSDAEWKSNLEKVQESRGMMRLDAARAGLPFNVLIDATVGNMKFSAEGDDTKGYRVSLLNLGVKPQQFFVSKDEGAYRVVTDGQKLSEAGNELLYLLDAHRDDEAASLLDWMRDRLHKGGGDDPLSGPLFPRFWTIGSTKGEDAMRLAAASLVAYTPAVKPLISVIHAALDKATSDEERDRLTLLMATAEYQAEDGAAVKASSAKLLEKYPDSYAALALAGEGFALLKDFKSWDQLLDGQIARHSDDEQLLRMKAEEGNENRNFAETRAAVQKIIDAGKATASDYNLYAWSALFDNHFDADVNKAAQQASMLTQNDSFSVLHTMACVYAAQGKTAEAGELLQKAMAADHLLEPNSSIWFGYGLIYEQYGVKDAAIEAYRKVERPEGRIGPDDTYVLAQARLKSLEVTRQ